MLRTMNPSVLVPSAAAIAAEITAINSVSSVSETCASFAAGSFAGTLSFFISAAGFLLNAFSIAGINLNKEIISEMKINTTHTVPIPSTVLSPAFSNISPVVYSASTVMLSRYSLSSNTNVIVASRSLNSASVDTFTSLPEAS